MEHVIFLCVSHFLLGEICQCKGRIHSSLEKVFMYNIKHKMAKPSVHSHGQISPMKEFKEVC